ncbi:heterokaryon incompatibility protein-domain-containing protein [Ilyonectria sp. MPI-CAGE-AT-0026]|nr:heterokaryon incompatibility protein-domain-containing protein [Ilyonectria sp. MPI-CAGE-AT-0026]
MNRLRRLIGRSKTPDIGETSGGPFEYTPLKDASNFRILRLQNSFRDANGDYNQIQLRGSLIEASIHSPPEYFALSYCWGDSTLSEEIIIDGQSLNITANCAAALRRMLRGKLGRHIWVDSICINQSNAPDALKERGLQVAMMDQIYRNATQVNVHLGEGDAASDIACKSLKSLSLAMIGANVGEVFRKKYDRLADDALMATPEFPYGKLHGVFRLQWFRRTWVVQEVALAKQVMFYCGAHLIRFELVVMGADFTKIPYSKLDVNPLARHWRSYLEFHSRVKELISWREEHNSTEKFTSLLSLLVVPGMLLEATRPEDKVFGMYGLCKRLGYELPAPDYQKSLAVVYTEAAKAILHYDQSLEFLSVATETSAWADGLPSWVPNFSGCMSKWSPSIPPTICPVGARESVKISDSTQCQYRLGPGDMELTVRGRRLNTISAVGKPWITDSYTSLLGGSEKNTMQYADSLIDCIGSWLAVVQGLPKSSGREAAMEHMTRVLTNNISDKSPPVPFEDMVRYLAVLVDMSASENRTLFATLASLPNASLSRQQDEFLGLIAGCNLAITRIFGSIWQTMFRTESGYMGMGTHTLTGGDIVVLFEGCDVAGVIRPLTNGYRYVGPAYVDGIMDMGLGNLGSDSEWFVLV